MWPAVRSIRCFKLALVIKVWVLLKNDGIHNFEIFVPFALFKISRSFVGLILRVEVIFIRDFEFFKFVATVKVCSQFSQFVLMEEKKKGKIKTSTFDT